MVLPPLFGPGTGPRIFTYIDVLRFHHEFAQPTPPAGRPDRRDLRGPGDRDAGTDAERLGTARAQLWPAHPARARSRRRAGATCGRPVVHVRQPRCGVDAGGVARAWLRRKVPATARPGPSRADHARPASRQTAAGVSR